MSGIDLLIPQSALWYMLVVAVLTGAGLGVLCDGLFILRVLCRDPRAASTNSEQTQAPAICGRVRTVAYVVLRTLCDLIFVLTATIILLLLCYYTSDGQLRAPAVVGLTLGFWIYRKTVSRFLRKLWIHILSLIFHALHLLWSHTLGRILTVALSALMRHLRAFATERRIRKLRRDAARGFGISEDALSEPKS